MTDRAQPTKWLDFVAVFAVALAARLSVVLWAGSDFVPTADGHFYDVVARRIAGGHGYTWLWPDGAVTYAAHYPVGYSALLAPWYWLFGEHPGCAWLLNATLHLSATWAIGSFFTQRHARTIALLAYSLHPALFFYTPALMTEAVTGDLWVLAIAALRGTGWRRVLVAGLLLGVATLVRPQSIVVAAGLACGALWWRLAPRWWAAALVAIPLVVCAPWTARNCVRMQQCALVSVNGGWNLLIGASTESGAWEALTVPDECREVWDEAAKDRCFGAAARHRIREEPLRWLARAPAKLSATFDYFGAAPYTLHESNPAIVGERGKLVLGVVETVWQRALWIALALGMLWRGRRSRARGLMVLGAIALAASLTRHTAAVAVLASVVAALAWPPRRSWPWLACAVVQGSTLLMHAAFFGGGRYGLVVVPWVVFAAVGNWTAHGASDDAETLHGSSINPAKGGAPRRSRSATGSSPSAGNKRKDSSSGWRSVNASCMP